MFWTREIAGWLLVVVALFLVQTGLQFVRNLDSPRIIEASVVMFGAMGVLRAGIYLIRMSTAARICRAELRTDKAQTP
ncbi:MAG: hypothetical protein JNL58_24790 [Planctomyces sp.]|nr:hypothetical protein [Planctomyces sp.]